MWVSIDEWNSGPSPFRECRSKGAAFNEMIVNGKTPTAPYAKSVIFLKNEPDPCNTDYWETLGDN